MPPRPEVIGSIQVLLNYAGPAGTKALNVLHVLGDPGVTMADLQNLANIVDGKFVDGGSGPCSQISNAWTLEGASVTELTGAFRFAQGATAGRLGAISAASLSPNTALCVSWKIAGRYKGGHPRTYMPGVPETMTTVPGGNLVTAAYADSVRGAWEAMRTAVAATVPSIGAWQLGSIERHRQKLVLNPPLFNPFTTEAVNERLDSQRRRLGKPGV